MAASLSARVGSISDNRCGAGGREALQRLPPQSCPLCHSALPASTAVAPAPPGSAPAFLSHQHLQEQAAQLALAPRLPGSRGPPSPPHVSLRPPLARRLGGWHSYRASKAALNQLFKCAALEFERKRQPVAAILLHPGTCDTELSKPFQRVRTGTRTRARPPLPAGVRLGLGDAPWVLAHGTSAASGLPLPSPQNVPPRGAVQPESCSRRLPALPPPTPTHNVPPVLPLGSPQPTQNVPPEKLFSRERAVRQLLAVIDGASMADSGRFYDWEGKEVEW